MPEITISEYLVPIYESIISISIFPFSKREGRFTIWKFPLSSNFVSYEYDDVFIRIVLALEFCLYKYDFSELTTYIIKSQNYPIEFFTNTNTFTSNAVGMQLFPSSSTTDPHINVQGNVFYHNQLKIYHYGSDPN